MTSGTESTIMRIIITDVPLTVKNEGKSTATLFKDFKDLKVWEKLFRQYSIGENVHFTDPLKEVPQLKGGPEHKRVLENQMYPFLGIRKLHFQVSEKTTGIVLSKDQKLRNELVSITFKCIEAEPLRPHEALFYVLVKDHGWSIA